MDIPTLGSQPDADAIRLEARRLGLERHLLELHTYGVTLVPPERLGGSALIEALRAAILRVLADRHDLQAPDDWQTHSEPWGGPRSWCWLFEDEAFVQAALHPVALCLARFMCGRNVVLQGTPAIVKTRGTTSRAPRARGAGTQGDGVREELERYAAEGYLRLHTDTHGVPSPLPEWPQLVNISWLLTDYTSPEDGPTVLVPGSHRFGRMPRADESTWWRDDAPVRPVPLAGPAGSLAVWHGSLWHGSRPRTSPGMRITLPFIYGRSYLQPIHVWPEVIAQGGHETWVEHYPELQELLGLWHPYPTDRDGPGVPQDPTHNMRMINAGDNIYA